MSKMQNPAYFTLTSMKMTSTHVELGSKRMTQQQTFFEYLDVNTTSGSESFSATEQRDLCILNDHSSGYSSDTSWDALSYDSSVPSPLEFEFTDRRRDISARLRHRLCLAFEWRATFFADLCSGKVVSELCLFRALRAAQNYSLPRHMVDMAMATIQVPRFMLLRVSSNVRNGTEPKGYGDLRRRRLTGIPERRRARVPKYRSSFNYDARMSNRRREFRSDTFIIKNLPKNGACPHLHQGFSPLDFQRYIAFHARKLTRDNGFVIVLPLIYRSLWQGLPWRGREKDLLSFAKTARPFVVRAGVYKQPRARIPARQFGGSFLQLGDERFFNLVDWIGVQGRFKNDKPIWKAGADYLCGRLPVSRHAWLFWELSRVEFHAYHASYRLQGAAGSTMPEFGGSLNDISKNFGSQGHVDVTVDADLLKILGELTSTVADMQRQGLKTNLQVDMTTLTDSLENVASLGAAIYLLTHATSPIQMVGGCLALMSASRMSRDLISKGLQAAKHYAATFQGDAVEVKAAFSSDRDVDVGPISDDCDQADEDQRSFLGDIFSNVVAAISNALFGADGALRTWIAAVADEIKPYLRKQALTTFAKELVTMVVDFFKSVVTRLRECISQRSMLPLFGSRFDANLWGRRVQAVVQYMGVITGSGNSSSIEAMKSLEELRKKKLIPEEFTKPLTSAEYSAYCDELIADGHTIKRIAYFSPALCREVTSILQRLDTHKNQLEAAAVTGYFRASPFMIFYAGKSAVGKTSLARLVAKAIGRDNAYDLTSRGTYDWVIDANFQTGLDHMCWHLVFDDIDQTEIHGQFPFVDVVRNAVNNTPLRVEAADLTMKGLIRACPVLVSMTSNFKYCNLKGKIVHPEVFWRRISLHVEVTMKEEYSNNGALDKEKVKAAATHDIYELKVSEYDASRYKRDAPFTSFPFKLIKVMSTAEFTIFARKRFKAHLVQQHERAKLAMAQGAICQNCLLDSELTCNCVVKKQGIAEASANYMKVIGANLAEAIYCTNSASRLLFAWLMMLWCNFMYLVFRRTIWAQNAAIKARDRLIELAIDRLGDTFVRDFMPKAMAVLAGAVVAGLIGWGALRLYQSRLQGEVPDTWHRVAVENASLVRSQRPTWTLHDVEAAVRDSYVTVSGTSTARGLVVGQNLLLYTQHIAPIGTRVVITAGSKKIECDVTSTNCVSLSQCPEIVLLRVPGLPLMRSVAAYIPQARNVLEQSYDAVRIYGRNDVVYEASRADVCTPTHNYGVCIRAAIDTQDGDCGSAYVTRKGNDWFLTAMHFLHMENAFMRSPHAFGGLLLRCDIESAAARIGGVMQGISDCMEQFSVKPVTFEALPPKSEVRTAITYGSVVTPYGEMNPRPFGSTFKSSVTPAVTSKYFESEIREWTGVDDYWRVPSFKGAMVDGKWQSVYQEPLLHHHPTKIDEKVLLVSVADYLSGTGRLDTGPLPNVTLDKALAGDGHYWLNPINLSTSQGPPVGGPKTKSFARDEDGVYYVSPDQLNLYNTIGTYLKQGATAFYAKCTPKDEPIKPGKVPRLFSVLGAAANLWMKQACSAVKIMMRAHLEHFESTVGIDMSSRDCARVIRHLASVDPDLKHLLERDAKSFDKSWNPEFWDAVAWVVTILARHAGVDCDLAHNCVVGLKHCRYDIKGDVFTSYWNPSGHDATVEWNGIFMSIAHRYEFYRAHPDLVAANLDVIPELFDAFSGKDMRLLYRSVMPFRLSRALVHYGDDSLMNVAEYCPEEFVYDVWLHELGVQMLDAKTKSALADAKPLAEVSFLKRAFVWDEDLDSYRCPIEKKTLARMLAMKKDSTLSRWDHACVAIANVMREAVLHGEEFYNSLYPKVCSFGVENDLIGNKYWDVPTYEVRRGELKDGKFSSWTSASALLARE